MHAVGQLESFSDAESLRGHLNVLTDVMERDVAEPWSVSDAPGEFVDAMVRAITGLRLKVDRLEGIRKLNQNQRQNDRDGVIAGLSQSENPMSQLVAAEMSKDI